jgi:hypothetical protein
MELDGSRMRGILISLTGEALVIDEKSGERSLPRAMIRQVRVFDSARRVRWGILWMLVGGGAGAAGGAAICPSCQNEGHAGKFIGPGVAIGAGIGALGFLSQNYLQEQTGAWVLRSQRPRCDSLRPRVESFR